MISFLRLIVACSDVFITSQHFLKILPSFLKKFCSIGLLRSWFLLVPAHDGDDPRADAISLLKKLWERSFIESNAQFSSDECYVLNFKVHDVIRDLAFYLLEKDCGTPPAKQLYFYRGGRNLEDVPEEQL
jgi:hypothetical protein